MATIFKDRRYSIVAAVAVLLSSVGTLNINPPAAAENAATAPAPVGEHHSLVKWQEWSSDLFTRARQENKPVILDLEAIWCHWCHVQDAKTYSDPQIAQLMNTKFIPVKVDQDSRPDLSNRYEDYGWPATVLFKPNGDEIEIRSGYVPPKDMLALLQSVAKNPNHSRIVKKGAAIAFAKDAVLSAALRKELNNNHIEGYDTDKGGWGFDQKFLDWDTVEYAMSQAKSGDAAEEKRAKETLRLQRKLIDPVWGGVYQYSVHGDWNEPHFEKIMQMQAEDMRVYALAYALWHNPLDLKAAQDIERFLRTFLSSPDGAFYTSQDADLVQGQHSGEYFALNDADRRKRGIPRIDKHIYARENGWAINSLAQLYMSTGDAKYLDEAQKAADWIIANRSLGDGGFAHGEHDKGGPFMGDTLAMGRAFLNLYTATGERQWLAAAEKAAKYVDKNFNVTTAGGTGAGFATADLKKTVPAPKPLLDENVGMARFANLLYRYTGNEHYQKMAKEAMRYLATPAIARQRHILVAGTLLADQELGNDPAHVTIIGAKDDPQALALFKSAIQYPSGYKRIEWRDKKEGPLPNPDVEYPDMPKAAAFGCIDGRCSAPVYKPEAVLALFGSDEKQTKKTE